jgi:hypothetical protein
MRRVAGRALQRFDDHLLDLGVGDRPGPPRTRLVAQPIQTQLGKPVTTLPHRRVINTEPCRDLAVADTLSR